MTNLSDVVTVPQSLTRSRSAGLRQPENEVGGPLRGELSESRTASQF